MCCGRLIMFPTDSTSCFLETLREKLNKIKRASTTENTEPFQVPNPTNIGYCNFDFQFETATLVC